MSIQQNLFRLTNTGNLTDVFCRRNYVDSNSNKKFADGHYVVDAITVIFL